MKPQTINYRKAKGVIEPELREHIAGLLSKNNIIVMTAAFLLGRSILTGGLMPFGFPLFAATYGLKVNRIAVIAAIMAGTGSRGDGRQVLITAAAAGMFMLLNTLTKKAGKVPAHILALTAMASILTPRIVIDLQNGPLLFDIINTAFHGFLVLVLVIIYYKASVVLSDEAIERGFSHEEVISMAIVASLCVAGLSELRIAGFSAGKIMSITLILLFSFKHGPGAGTAVGLTAGIILSMAPEGNHMMISSYAFCGLLSGILGKMGKTGSCIGFVMGNALLTMYLTGSTEILIHIKDIIAGTLLFFIIPQRAGEWITGFFASGPALSLRKEYKLSIKEITVGRLQRLSRAFKEISRTFEEISQAGPEAGKADISGILERVADKVCRECGLRNHCWDRNFYSTYQAMFKIIDMLEKNGKIYGSDIPGYFVERCERIDDFVTQVNNVYELSRLDMAWKRRIDETRSLVSQQMKGLSFIVEELASEIDSGASVRKDMGERLVTGFRGEGIKVDDVIVLENRGGCYEILVKHGGCSGSMPCKTAIPKMIRKITGRRMKREGECGRNNKKGGCTLRLVQENTYSVTTGVAHVPKHGNSVTGDSYMFMETCGGKYVAAISDGMGSGESASKMSRTTIVLIEQFMEAGFDKDTTVKMVNSLLLLKSGEEAFSTIDLTVVDLFSGEAEFLKAGAVPSYIKGDRGVGSIRAVSFPAGIFGRMETEMQGKKLKSGDFVIMMSDGVLECFGDDSISTMREFIEDIDSINPQSIADEILDKAYSKCSGKPGDDMTVVVSKIWKRQG